MRTSILRAINFKPIAIGIAGLVIVGSFGLLSVGKVQSQSEIVRSPEAQNEGAPAGGGWEYLIVSGGNVNFEPMRDSRMRKEQGPFARENYPLEQNLDKLGQKGWELVQISGTAADPIFYFKRRK